VAAESLAAERAREEERMREEEERREAERVRREGNLKFRVLFSFFPISAYLMGWIDLLNEYICIDNYFLLLVAEEAERDRTRRENERIKFTKRDMERRVGELSERAVIVQKRRGGVRGGPVLFLAERVLRNVS
jgi:hypothetical protein